MFIKLFIKYSLNINPYVFLVAVLSNYKNIRQLMISIIYFVRKFKFFVMLFSTTKSVLELITFIIDMTCANDQTPCLLHFLNCDPTSPQTLQTKAVVTRLNRTYRFVASAYLVQVIRNFYISDSPMLKTLWNIKIRNTLMYIILL